jgi:hypothetical protein
MRDHFFLPNAPVVLKPLSIVAEVCPFESDLHCMRKGTGKELAIPINYPRIAGHVPLRTRSLRFYGLQDALCRLAIFHPRLNGTSKKLVGNFYLDPLHFCSDCTLQLIL